MTDRPDWIPLVEDARVGDRRAQSELLARFEPLVRSTAVRLAPFGLVDDVVQQSWVAALESISRLRTCEAFPAWLRLIVRKQAARVRPGHVAAGLDAVAEQADVEPGPELVAVRNEVESVVRLALSTARDQDRQLLELRYLAGWSNDELAELLGIKPGTVRKRLHDARRRLRSTLEHLNPKEPTMSDYRDLLGTVHAATVDIAAPPALRPPSDARTVTGLKTIDTLAPIRRGGTIEMVGPAGTGHVVVAFELLYRLGRTEHEVACVGVGRSGLAIGSQPDLAHIVTEEGIPGPNAAILADEDADLPRAFDAGARLAAGLAAEGLDVILAVDRPTLDAVSSAELRGAAGLAAEGSVTVVALNTSTREVDAVQPLGLDATLTFSMEHLALGIFPAIDGARSTSVLEISDAARTTKERLSEAATLRGWFNQPMYVAQDYTGEDGIWIEPDLADMELADLVS